MDAVPRLIRIECLKHNPAPLICVNKSILDTTNDKDSASNIFMLIHHPLSTSTTKLYSLVSISLSKYLASDTKSYNTYFVPKPDPSDKKAAWSVEGTWNSCFLVNEFTQGCLSLRNDYEFGVPDRFWTRDHRYNTPANRGPYEQMKLIPLINNSLFSEADSTVNSLDETLRSDMRSMLRNARESKYSDIEFECCDGESVFAHKAILEARSEFFRVMFQDRFLDSNTKKIDAPLQSDSNSLLKVLEVIYTGEMNLDGNESVEFLVSIWDQADFYVLPKIKEVVERGFATALNRQSTFQHDILEFLEDRENLVEIATQILACQLLVSKYSSTSSNLIINLGEKSLKMVEMALKNITSS